MTPDGVLIFLAQYGTAAVLDRAINWLSGESRRSHEMYQKLERSLDIQEKTLPRVDKIVRMLERQQALAYDTGIAALKRAQRCAMNSSGYEHNLREAISRLTECAAGEQFSRLSKARILMVLSASHMWLGEKENAIAALRDARTLADDEAKAQNERYVRLDMTESIVIRLPDGRVIPAKKRIIVDEPNIPDGALALKDIIDRALARVT